MKTFTTYAILFLVFLFLCLPTRAGDDVRPIRELTPLEKETFDLLKAKFPGEILDADLETLHAVAESAEYKHFLKEAYPDASVPPEFVRALNSEGPLVDDTLYRIRPPKERYGGYYREYFGIEDLDEVLDIEHFMVHHYLTDSWIYKAEKWGGDIPPYLPSKKRLRRSSRADPTIWHSAPFKEMVVRRGLGVGIELFRNYDLALAFVRTSLLADDTRWVQSLFERYGSSDGVLMLALQDPAFFSRVRYTFTTDTTFLSFVETDPEAAEAAARAKSRERHRSRQETQP